MRAAQDEHGGFPFSVDVAEETSETLRRLSAVEVAEELPKPFASFVSLNDWTQFLIAARMKMLSIEDDY